MSPALLRNHGAAIIARCWTAIVRKHFGHRVVALANENSAPVHGGIYG